MSRTKFIIQKKWAWSKWAYAVDNALRHMPPGGTLLLHAGPFAGGVRMTISDAGEGIPPADLPYVFGCFWRGDRADAEV